MLISRYIHVCSLKKKAWRVRHRIPHRNYATENLIDIFNVTASITFVKLADYFNLNNILYLVNYLKHTYTKFNKVKV